MENRKEKILFIAPYPKGEAPSQRFRFEQYLAFISREYIVEESFFWSSVAWEKLYHNSNYVITILSFTIAFLRRFILMFKIYKYDYIFIHREVTPLGPPIFEYIISKVLSKKIIYDFDDAIWLHNTSDKNKWVKYLKASWKVKYICKWSYKVSCGNQFLADYARRYNQRVEVIPTTIDMNYHKKVNKEDKIKVSIGWTGTHSTIKYLQMIQPIIKKLEQSVNFDFIVISDKEPDIDVESLCFIQWNKKTEIEDLNKIDIGVMPLYDGDWEKGKCGFKGLQYMALEIPAVISPVGANLEIVQHGKSGYTPYSQEEWIRILTKLLKDKEERSRVGKIGKQTVVERYSVEANKSKYLSLFK